MVVEPSSVSYAHAGDIQVAYRVMGDGPQDLVFHHGFPSHLEIEFEHPAVSRFYGRLASFSRLILYDRRGVGLSERGLDIHGFEARMDDVIAVLNAVGSDRAVHVGNAIGGRLALLFAATHPDRASGVVTIAAHPATLRDEDYPWGATTEEMEAILEGIRTGWGAGRSIAELLQGVAPSAADDAFTRDWWLRLIRSSMSPRETVEELRALANVDIRSVLSSVHAPTLILHRVDDRMADIRAGRYMAVRIPGARFVELPGKDELPFFGDQDALLDEIEEFVTGVRPAPQPHRVLATVLFTDIVDSTKRAADEGDHRWRGLLEAHRTVIRRELGRFNGREVDTAGDGFLATFDGPARAIRCALTAVERVRGVGLEIRAGLHTGEIEVLGDDVGGLAVHIGARVAALAGPSEVLVSRTVRDLVAGSGIAFEDRGTRALKGVPDEWHIFRVTAG